MIPARNRRAGLTRLEVVILIVVAAFALGLGAMALVRSQAAARRIYCANNLKQIGQATFLFQEAKGYLPPSRIDAEYATWAVLLAPYLEKTEGNGLRSWDLSRLYYEQPEEVRRAQVVWYYCPARREPPRLSVSGDVPSDGLPQNVPFTGALGDYAAAAGDGSLQNPWDGPDSGAAFVEAEVKYSADHGVLSWRGRTSVRLIQVAHEPVLQVSKAEGAPPPLQELKRGTSSTVLLGEKHVPWGKFGRTEQGDGSLYNGDYPGSFSRVGGVGYGLAQSVADPYNRNFGSAHTGVCQFLMADCSVRPLANEVSPEILGKLMLRDPGE
jgi:hypothetical protein